MRFYLVSSAILETCISMVASPRFISDLQRTTMRFSKTVRTHLIPASLKLGRQLWDWWVSCTWNNNAFQYLHLWMPLDLFSSNILSSGNVGILSSFDVIHCYVPLPVNQPIIVKASLSSWSKHIELRDFGKLIVVINSDI